MIMELQLPVHGHNRIYIHIPEHDFCPFIFRFPDAVQYPDFRSRDRHGIKVTGDISLQYQALGWFQKKSLWKI